MVTVSTGCSKDSPLLQGLICKSSL